LNLNLFLTVTDPGNIVAAQINCIFSIEYIGLTVFT